MLSFSNDVSQVIRNDAQGSDDRWIWCLEHLRCCIVLEVYTSVSRVEKMRHPMIKKASHWPLSVSFVITMCELSFSSESFEFFHSSLRADNLNWARRQLLSTNTGRTVHCSPVSTMRIDVLFWACRLYHRLWTTYSSCLNRVEWGLRSRVLRHLL